MRPFYSSPSRSLAIDNCPRAYFWQYEAKARPAISNHALLFGEAYDEVWNWFLLRGRGQISPQEAEEAFEAKWAPVEQQSVRFSSRGNWADLLKIGKALAHQIPDAWDASGYELLKDRNGLPMVQRDLLVRLAPDHIHRMKIDLVVRTRDGQIGVVDNKTASAATAEHFVAAAEQLLDYQIAVDAIAASNGWGPVEMLAFWESLKSKSNPRILPPNETTRHSDADVRERIEKLRWQRQVVQLGHFPKSPRMAFNTPCGMCDFAKGCLERDTEDLTIPPEGLRLLVERGWLDATEIQEAA
jgi:hypothetical protein